MKILIIGAGGREHAIAKKISNNKNITTIFCAPGNGGTKFESKCQNANINGNENLLQFALKNNIDFTIVGPEEPLCNGIVDLFEKNNLKIFGPNKLAAQLEASKAFSKDFMKKYNIATADYNVFDKYDTALQYLKAAKFPLVIKADGLAAGKGVIICDDIVQAQDAIFKCMKSKVFLNAGEKIVIEQFLHGVEVSFITICDGKTITPFISAKDHKQAYDHNKGPNTGGMGVICPNNYATIEVIEDFKNNIMIPTLEGIKAMKMDYKGFLFFGIMITSEGCKCLEYNVRLGDPETQSLFALMKSDLFDLIKCCYEKKLDTFLINWKKQYAINVVLCANGYPDKYQKNISINIPRAINKHVIIAGANYTDNILYSSGGRILSTIGVSKYKWLARCKVYFYMSIIKNDKTFYRKDIGKNIK